MKKFFTIFFGLMVTSLFAQSFSFLDNIEVGTRLVYIHPVKSVTQNVSMWVLELDPNHAPSTLDGAFVETKGVQNVRDYLTMEYDIKYFMKVHKRFRMGLGANYKQRHLDADYYMNGLRQGNTYSPLVYLGQTRITQNYFALNLNFRRTLPKWNANVTFGFELSTLLNKKRFENTDFKGIRTTIWLDGMISKVDIQNRVTGLTEDFNSEPSVYLNLQKKLWKNLFVMAQVNKLLNSGYRYEINYYYDSLSLGRVAGALVEDTKYTYSLGLAWQFFGNKKNKKK